nr:hypothetical protein [uncultured Lichenicoccus sp.]
MRGRLGCLAVVIAMACQLLLGAMMTAEPARAQRVALVAADLLCSSSNVPDGHRRPRHHSADIALCPTLLALQLPASMLASPVAVLAPVLVVRSRLYDPPLAQGPPAVRSRPGSPRGPPPTI